MDDPRDPTRVHILSLGVVVLMVIHVDQMPTRLPMSGHATGET
jgi:hypothetical protein